MAKTGTGPRNAAKLRAVCPVSLSVIIPATPNFRVASIAACAKNAR